MRTIVAIFFCVFFLRAAGQSSTASYATIDKRVKTIHAATVGALVGKLTVPYKTDREKVRSIFRWITENIAYDVVGYHNPKGAYEGLWEKALAMNVAEVNLIYNWMIVQKVLDEKVAICDGYSRLFKTLCDSAQIRCEIVLGSTRSYSDRIGLPANGRHAWNAVYLDNSWKLVDATWASGFCDSSVTRFTRNFDPFYFFTDPIQLFNNHYPDEQRWSLLRMTPSLQQFYDFPYYYKSFYDFRVLSLQPTSGVIEVSKKDMLIRFELGIADKVTGFYMAEYPYIPDGADSTAVIRETEEPGDSQLPAYTVTDGKLVCVYKVKSQKSEQVRVILNNKLILHYGIKFR
ncbi:MAG: hypothetical protein EOO05_17135 [Chitinophagaceae bacterium]|nr:MAG: hypothetical protein EOO05_17135 [Chitinophagaceae bacterium]